MSTTRHGRGIGNVIAPLRFIAFVVVATAASGAAIPVLGIRHGVMIGFDAGALLFLMICLPLLRHDSGRMRLAAAQNDANRAILLLITGAVMLVILASVATELMQKHAPRPWSLALIVGTLALSWTFSNTIYTLHYAHLFYREGKDGDCGGLRFPETDEPDYWDFVYFSFCLGMTFQTSDVNVTQGHLRQAVTLHCIAAFVFNLGILAFTINVLGAS